MNNNRYVNKEKRKRVLEAVNRLGYRPNFIARVLKGKKTNHIIFITDQIIDANIPVVLLANRDYHEIEGAAKIDSGLYEGTKESVRYLFHAGCRNIIYIDRFSRNGHFSDSKLRISKWSDLTIPR